MSIFDIAFCIASAIVLIKVGHESYVELKEAIRVMHMGRFERLMYESDKWMTVARLTGNESYRARADRFKDAARALTLEEA